jgi:hypothetical protein
MFSAPADNSSMRAPRTTDTISGGYTQIPQKYYNPNAARNALGLVGGNEVSVASGNIVDLESDLYGITRDLSRVPGRRYQPYCPLGSELASVPTSSGPAATSATMGPLYDTSCPAWPKQLVFTERSTGKVRTVNTAPRHLPTIQVISYPGVPAPDPLVQDVYGAPWRF